MNEKMREERENTIYVFDFDGTLTTKDSLWSFLVYAKGYFRCFFALVFCSPMLVLALVHIYSKGKAKEKLLGFLFKGMKKEAFEQLGIDFSNQFNAYRKETVEKVRAQLSEGNKVYCVTASVEDWVLPCCRKIGIENVVATRMEVKEDCLTGRFASLNCYGKEKVRRLLEKEPARESYRLVAYGDSRGDKEMIEFSDEGYYI